MEIEKFQENPAQHLEGRTQSFSNSEDDQQHYPSQNTISSPASRGASTFDPEKLRSSSPSPGSDQKLPYEPGSWYLAVAGVCLTFIAGFAFVGFAVHLTRNTRIADIDAVFGDTGVWFVKFSSTRRSLIDLALNVVVTICTETVGMIHSTTQRWSLASEGNLDFSANLRLFVPKGKGRWWSPLGPVASGVHAVALIVSYVTASMIFLPVATRSPVGHYFRGYQAVSFIPSTILGTAFIFQGLLALAALLTVKVPTWSNNCLDVVGAAIHHRYVTPVPNRCLRSLSDNVNPEDQSPIYPSDKQISMWHAHRRVRRVVYFVWFLLPLVILWTIIIAICITQLKKATNARIGRVEWNLIPDIGGEDKSGGERESGALGLSIGWLADLIPNSVTDKALPVRSMILFITIIAAIQGCLTIGLNCCELIVALARDEATWRACGSAKGGHQSDNSLINTLKNWQPVSLLVLKPFVHWLYSNCVGIQAGFGMVMLPIQLFYLFLGMVVLSTWATVVARKPVKGNQPAAYGHIQTLANLVDDWRRSTDPNEPKKFIPKQIYQIRNWRRDAVGGRMYWGHKSRSSESGVCHAGTSYQPLTSIRSAVLYAKTED